MSDWPKTHHCSKCGRVVDRRTATTLTLQKHWLEEVEHWRSGQKYTMTRSKSLMPHMKLCKDCESKAIDMLEGWMKE